MATAIFDRNTVVKNNLTTADEGYVLDARQGKAINDRWNNTFKSKSYSYTYRGCTLKWQKYGQMCFLTMSGECTHKDGIAKGLVLPPESGTSDASVYKAYTTNLAPYAPLGGFHIPVYYPNYTLTRVYVHPDGRITTQAAIAKGDTPHITVFYSTNNLD